MNKEDLKEEVKNLLKEVIKENLKEHLKIDSYEKYDSIHVEIFWDDEEISDTILPRVYTSNNAADYL